MHSSVQPEKTHLASIVSGRGLYFLAGRKFNPTENAIALTLALLKFLQP